MFYSLKSRLIAIFAVLLVFSFASMSLLLFRESRSIIRSYIESSALEKMDEYGSFISMATMQLYDLSSIVFNSDMTKRWDAAMSNPALPEGEKMLADIALSQFLTRTTNSYSSISSVTVYREDGRWIGLDNQVVRDPSFLETNWYSNFKTAGAHWVSAHDDPVETGRDKHYEVVSLLLPIGTFDPSSARSLMKVNVRADFLLEPLDRIHLGGDGTIYLLDEQGRPMLGQPGYGGDEQTVRQVEAIRSGPQKQGVVYVTGEKGRKDILVYKKLDRSDWMLVGLVSENDLFAKLNALRTSVIVFTTLLLVVAIVLATWLSYGITKPLSRLVFAMRYVQQGDFDVAESRIPPKRSVRNEVGFVTETFRTMVVQLRQNIRTEFELKLLRQQAEYRALLMQINPHFLFNTLELMSSLAIQRRIGDTVDVIESLGKMLRFSLKGNEDVVALEEELTYLRHYVSILRIRFGERLNVDIVEDGDTARLTVVKFILQPLVENAVKHGFRQESDVRVDIRVRRMDGKLRLSVADNGPGMPPELIERLRTESEARQLDEVLSSASRQIGLRNVLIRCKLYYGPLFSFAIESEAGRGTRIDLMLPAGEGNADVPRLDRG